MNIYCAEFFGTFWLDWAACGSAVLVAAFPDLGIGFVGGWATAQPWLFWMAPLAGGLLGAVIYRLVGGRQ